VAACQNWNYQAGTIKSGTVKTDTIKITTVTTWMQVKYGNMEIPDPTFDEVAPRNGCS
jgi:hypothetical protein